MILPILDDTIIAVSTAWQPSPLGILRLSGPRAFALLEHIGVDASRMEQSHSSGGFETRIRLPEGLALPASIFIFRGPGSYTGQDVAEIHTIGSLPVLRRISSVLIEKGARRALPGEFTARGFLNGRIRAEAVDEVLALIQSQDRSANLQAARQTSRERTADLERIARELTALLSSIEAGIDFVEEEDVQFITPGELVEKIGNIVQRVERIAGGRRDSAMLGMPHVALAGRPNAGKSTLFNALIGRERAIVTPILGTTRDVLSAEIEIEGVRAVVQDCAGLGRGVDELEAAAHVAAERALDQADLVLWLHVAGEKWDSEEEAAACERVSPERRILVLSQCDRGEVEVSEAARPAFQAMARISAMTGAGVANLRAVMAEMLVSSAGGVWAGDTRLRQGVGVLRGVLDSLDGNAAKVQIPEIVSLELRRVLDLIELTHRGPLVEEILENIYTRFCVGK